MSAERPIPAPLQGPLNLRTLFFSHGSEPILARMPRMKKRRVAMFAIAAILALVFWRTVASYPLADFLWGLSVAIWAGTEVCFGLLGAVEAVNTVRRWRLTGRLAQVVLTELRPIAIGQVMLVHFFGPLLVPSAWLYAASSAILLWYEPAAWPFVILFGVITVNAAVAAYSQAWIHLTLWLSELGVLHRLWTSYVCQVIYGIVLLFGLGGAFALHQTLLNSMGRGSGRDAVTCLALAVLGLGLSSIRLLLARGFAARLEQVVFPRMEL